jgi:molecular chaperone DnaK (HSP70)
MGHSLELIDGPMLLDMLALPIGVANELANTKGGGIKVQNIFPKLTPLSTRKSFKLSELLALAPQGVLRLCQGEAEEFAANEYIGDIQLQLKLLEADPSEVQVTFELSREGILRILAQVGGVGKVELLQLELSQALPEEFSDQMTVEKSTSSVPVKESRSIFGKFFSKG